VPHWLVQIQTHPRPPWVLIERLNPEGTAVLDYRLVAGGRKIFVGGQHHTHVPRHQAGDLGTLLDRICAAN
jgi:hypothetical protein